MKGLPAWLSVGDMATAAPPPSEDRNYTDVITNALIDAATNPAASGYVSALETAAGQLSRAFASANVSGSGAVMFDPWTLAQIGRQLVESGEAVWYRMGNRLRRVLQYSILPTGQYQLTFPLARVLLARPDQVLHVKWNVEPATFRGISPLGMARTLAELMAKIEGSLNTEANANVGYLLPVPSDGGASNVEKLKADLRTLAGNIALVETTQGGWGSGQPQRPRREFELARLGPAFPEGNVRLFTAAREAVLSACGYPVPLSRDTNGTGQREAWRRYLHGTVAPMGRLVTTEAATIRASFNMNFDALFASDIAGRARAFQSLVGGGMELAQAAAVSGLLVEE